MHQGIRKNDRNVKSIMKSKEKNTDGSTGDIDEDSFVDDDSSVSSSRSHDEQDENSKSTSNPSADVKRKPNVLQLAGRETAYVLCSKTMAYLVLLLSSIACGVVTFYFIQDDEEDTFRNDVRDTQTQILCGVIDLDGCLLGWIGRASRLLHLVEILWVFFV